MKQLKNTDNFDLMYPNRSYTFLRPSPIMTQFDNIGVFEFEDYYNRKIVQRQMHVLKSSIAKSYDLTVNATFLLIQHLI